MKRISLSLMALLCLCTTQVGLARLTSGQLRVLSTQTEKLIAIDPIGNQTQIERNLARIHGTNKIKAKALKANFEEQQAQEYARRAREERTKSAEEQAEGMEAFGLAEQQAEALAAAARRAQKQAKNTVRLITEIIPLAQQAVQNQIDKARESLPQQFGLQTTTEGAVVVPKSGRELSAFKTAVAAGAELDAWLTSNNMLAMGFADLKQYAQNAQATLQTMTTDNAAQVAQQVEKESLAAQKLTTQVINQTTPAFIQTVIQAHLDNLKQKKTIIQQLLDTKAAYNTATIRYHTEQQGADIANKEQLRKNYESLFNANRATAQEAGLMSLANAEKALDKASLEYQKYAGDTGTLEAQLGDKQFEAAMTQAKANLNQLIDEYPVIATEKDIVKAE